MSSGTRTGRLSSNTPNIDFVEREQSLTTGLNEDWQLIKDDWPRPMGVEQPTLPHGVVRLANGAHIIDQGLLEANCGYSINPRAFDLRPGGARMIVSLVPDQQFYGNLAIPAGFAGEKKASGWVVYAGPTCGMGMEPYPGGLGLAPYDLPGKYVLFAAHKGEIVQMDWTRDSVWKSHVLIITERDIWAWLDKPEAYSPNVLIQTA